MNFKCNTFKCISIHNSIHFIATPKKALFYRLYCFISFPSNKAYKICFHKPIQKFFFPIKKGPLRGLTFFLSYSLHGQQCITTKCPFHFGFFLDTPKKTSFGHLVVIPHIVVLKKVSGVRPTKHRHFTSQRSPTSSAHSSPLHFPRTRTPTSVFVRVPLRSASTSFHSDFVPFGLHSVQTSFRCVGSSNRLAPLVLTTFVLISLVFTPLVFATLATLSLNLRCVSWLSRLRRRASFVARLLAFIDSPRLE